MTTFIQPPNKTPLHYTEELVAKTLRCGDVYEKQNLNKTLKKGTRQIHHTEYERILVYVKNRQ